MVTYCPNLIFCSRITCHFYVNMIDNIGSKIQKYDLFNTEVRRCAVSSVGRFVARVGGSSVVVAVRWLLVRSFVCSFGVVVHLLLHRRVYPWRVVERESVCRDQRNQHVDPRSTHTIPHRFRSSTSSLLSWNPNLSLIHI